MRLLIMFLALLLISVPTQAQTPIRVSLPLVVVPTRPPTATPTPSPTSSPSPTATVSPTATPTLPPASYNNCAADPAPSAAPNWPVRITAIDKAAETVTLKNLSGQAIDLTGWHMCSVTGNQQHPISGALQPGQSVTFSGPAGLIWNNATSDPGALYNAAGQLVSYWPD